MLLSTLTVAANNARCRVPLFAQVMERARNQFVGVYSDDDFRVSYEGVVLPRTPPDVRRLPDLAFVFR